MAAIENISGQQFYHGTWAGWLRKGQIIRPAKDLLGENMGLTNFSISSPEHVYVTTNPEDAKWYAELGYKNIEQMGHKINDIPVIGARPVVYQVQPRGYLQKDISKSAYKVSGDAKILNKYWSG